MNDYRFKPEFNIGDTVYHKTADSEQGVIVNIKYYALTNTITYIIAVGFGKEYECIGEEISETKSF